MKITKTRKPKENWWDDWKAIKYGSANQKRRPVLEQLAALFEKEKVGYRLFPHSEVFTAPELAASIHVTGRQVAKVVMLRADGRYVMAVLPSHRQLDLAHFGELIGASRVSLAKEWEMKELFPDCELGAMPPFGDLYGLPVYLDESLVKEPEIFFQAGSHHEVIEMRYKDFERLVHPKVGHFALEPAKTASGF
jgi:Ala-tRNA(Pro) deacylase